MSNSAGKSSFSTKDMVSIGLFAAILAVISQIALPIAAVPITIQVFGVALVGAVLGWKRGCAATIVYILLGAVGLPIFANFRGGLQVIVGTSGGYILSWPVLAILAGSQPKLENIWAKRAVIVALAVIGLLIVEAVGGFQWYWLTRGSEGAMSYGAIMTYSLVAFIPKDIVLVVLAVLIGERIRHTLKRAALL